jgi:hypothetical protein
VTASPAAANAPRPAAHASGGDVVTLTYPSIVQTRVDSTRRSLKRAAKQMDSGQVDKAAVTLKLVRRQLTSAWRGAKYVIRTTPPPPADEARAHASGDAPPGPALASPADSGFLVLTLQHDVAAGTVAIIDGADDSALFALGTTLTLALAQRDQSLKDILAMAPPAPPSDLWVNARASGGAPVVATFDTVMPNVLPQLDDEAQTIDGIRTDSPDLTAGGRRLLNSAATRVARTKGVVNKNWPPIPAEA